MSDKPKCTIDKCGNNAMYKGNHRYGKLCTTHHKKKYNMRRFSKQPKKYKYRHRKYKSVSGCAFCTYSGPCDKHRLIMGKDGGEYTKGNIIILCPNCHRLVHRGLLQLR